MVGIVVPGGGGRVACIIHHSIMPIRVLDRAKNRDYQYIQHPFHHVQHPSLPFANVNIF